MNNLIMPKQTAKLDRFYTSLEIFYNEYNKGKPNVTNSLFKEKIMDCFDDLKVKNNGAKIVKQSEMVRYFGFAIHDYEYNTTSITNRGIKMYEAYKKNNIFLQLDLIFDSIKNDTFGRRNTAIKSSDSDIEPPKLLLKSITDLNGITRKELAFMLYYTHDMSLSYQDAIFELKRMRSSINNTSIVISKSKVNKYSDPKFSSFLCNIGFCSQNKNKQMVLSNYVYTNYYHDINNLNIYNRNPSTTNIINSNLFVDTSTESKDTDCNDDYKKTVSSKASYDTSSNTFKSQNNRIPSIPEGSSKKNSRYKTDTRLAKTALMISDYKCEYNYSHITFKSKENIPFMEAHHLIPMIAQNDFFPINLDCIENIVSLCPNCHSAIHYGNDTERLAVLTKLFNKRKEKLKEIGIDISLDMLFKKYYK